MRSSVADYKVVEVLPAAVGGGHRFACPPPERLHLAEPAVMVTELAIEAAQWRELTDILASFASVGSDRLQKLIEVGPDLDPAGAGVYLVAEAAPGGSLIDAIGASSVGERIRAVAQAAQGAQALHEAGMAHGSICARSILLTDRGAVLSPPLLDLPSGVASKVLDWRDLATLDPDLLCGEEPSRASDVWALGATLHAVLSDRPLYPGLDTDPPVTAVQRILFTRPEFDPALPAAIAQVIGVCVDGDPSARPATAEEVADHLLALEVSR